ncbi:hypothetical protein TCAL_14283 [Tigriopus californicus]|uniref:Uncharacterized protein n=1 Tax=Tigriopus californicus TaxID=6832 RepID=A0A553NT63_TIGCA|nr:hypothetical protein TCAL_14283 [Tigriopus californicus]
MAAAQVPLEVAIEQFPALELKVLEIGGAATKASASAGGVELTPLKRGDEVQFQNPLTRRWDSGANVKEVHDYGRSYLISTPSGEFRRNRRFLRRSCGPDMQATPSSNPPGPNAYLAPVLRRGSRKRTKAVRFEAGQ